MTCTDKFQNENGWTKENHFHQHLPYLPLWDCAKLYPKEDMTLPHIKYPSW